MISGIDLSSTEDYTLKKDKENPTVWKLGVLTTSQMANIAAKTAIGDNVNQMIELVRLGLRGWDNFKIGDKPVEFTQEDGLIPMYLINIIPFAAIIELGTEILNINKLNPEETKN